MRALTPHAVSLTLREAPGDPWQEITGVRKTRAFVVHIVLRGGRGHLYFIAQETEAQGL